MGVPAKNTVVGPANERRGDQPVKTSDRPGEEITLLADETSGDIHRIDRQTEEEPEWMRMREGYNRQADRQR